MSILIATEREVVAIDVTRLGENSPLEVYSSTTVGDGNTSCRGGEHPECPQIWRISHNGVEDGAHTSLRTDPTYTTVEFAVKHMMFTRPRSLQELHRDEKPWDAVIDEREIDQILADSFPASDAPPWTLGVIQATKRSNEKKGTA